MTRKVRLLRFLLLLRPVARPLLAGLKLGLGEKLGSDALTDRPGTARSDRCFARTTQRRQNHIQQLSFCICTRSDMPTGGSASPVRCQRQRSHPSLQLAQAVEPETVKDSTLPEPALIPVMLIAPLQVAGTAKLSLGNALEFR